MTEDMKIWLGDVGDSVLELLVESLEQVLRKLGLAMWAMWRDR